MGFQMLRFQPCLAEPRESAVGKGRAIMICSICDNLSLFSACGNTVTLKESVTSKHDEFHTLYPLAVSGPDAVNRKNVFLQKRFFVLAIENGDLISFTLDLLVSTL